MTERRRFLDLESWEPLRARAVLLTPRQLCDRRPWQTSIFERLSISPALKFIVTVWTRQRLEVDVGAVKEPEGPGEVLDFRFRGRHISNFWVQI